jgi:hypothetical protein
VAGDVALRVEARTVVADFERDPLELSCQLYLYVGCAGVLDGIVVGEQRFYPSIGYRRRSIGTRGRPPRSPDHKSGRGSTTLDRQPDLTKGRAIHHQVDLQSRSVRDVEVSSSGRAPDEIQLHS